MQLYSECMYCIVEHHWSLVKNEPDEARRAAFMREVLRAVAEADPNITAPVPTAKLQKLYARAFRETDDFPRLKRQYNALLLQWLPELRAALQRADDPLRLAVWMAMAGNYIDFGVLREIDDARLREMLFTPDARAVDRAELQNLRRDLQAARAVTYACDNCGEIVLDMLLMEQIQQLNPNARITALVRGENVLNDATAEDAQFVGLDRIARIVGNGSNIGGTQIVSLRDEALRALTEADVTLAKGQGNFETLVGKNLNVYYLFLAKCPHYKKWFGMEHMTGQLVHESAFSQNRA